MNNLNFDDTDSQEEEDDFEIFDFNMNEEIVNCKILIVIIIFLNYFNKTLNFSIFKFYSETSSISQIETHNKKNSS